MAIAFYLTAWALSFALAFIIGPRIGRRYDALVLTGILGLLGLLVLGITQVLDGPDRSARDAR